MGFYQKHVVPWLIHVSMKHRDATRLRRELVPAAEGRVLEVGIGSGLNAPFYGGSVSTVFGIDPSDPLLKRAARASRSSDIPVEIVHGSAESLPFEADDFDTVLTTWTLCSIPDVRTALSEMRRVLKPSGALMFVEHGRAPEAVIQRWQDRVNPLWRPFAGGCNLNRDIARLIEEAGFRITDSETGYLIRGPRIMTYSYKGRAAIA